MSQFGWGPFLGLNARRPFDFGFVVVLVVLMLFYVHSYFGQKTVSTMIYFNWYWIILVTAKLYALVCIRMKDW